MSSEVALRGRDRARGRRIGAYAASLVVASLAALVGVVVSAPPAAAHATVSRSDPADQAHLPMAPTSVTIEFSEAVSPAVGGMTVLRADRTEVQTAVDQPEENVLRAALQPNLADGTYVATYRIISEDGHPITGSLVFGVGQGQLTDVSDLTTETDATMDALSKVGQFLMYLGALAAAGLVFFLAAMYEPCPSDRRVGERRAMARLAGWGAFTAVVGMVLVVLAQTAQATGEGLGAAFNGENLGGVLQQGLGAQDAGILIGLVLCLGSLWIAPGTASKVTAAVGGLVTASSFVLWGHAIEGANAWLTIPADAIHLVVAAVWFGGLVGLFIVLRSRTRAGLVAAPSAAGGEAPGARVGGDAPTSVIGEVVLGSSGTVTAVLDDPDPVDGGASVLVRGRDEPASGGGSGTGAAGGARGGDGDGSDLPATVLCVRRFSAAAFISLLVLSAAGVAVGLVEMGGLGGLFSTNYGRLLLAKLAVVAVVAAAAGYNRFYLLPWLLADSPEAAAVTSERQQAGWRTLLSTVRFEALAIVVVLVLTALLVNTTPTGTAAKTAPSGPLKQSLPIDGGQVTLDIGPNRPGTNHIMVTVTDAAGAPKEVLGVEVAMTLDTAGVGPITRKLEPAGAGHFMLDQTRDLSMAGEWDIDVVVRVDEFDEIPLNFKDTIS
jgi:copper transport protein